jgi:hypothetical protein
MYEAVKDRFFAYINALPLTPEQRKTADTLKLGHTLRVAELSEELARSVFGGKTQAYVHIVRDADKIDGLFLNQQAYKLNDDAWKKVLPFSAEHKLSDEIYQTIMETRLANNADRQTIIDFKFFIMAWVYDIKLKKSMDIIREKGYIHALYNDIPNPDTRMQQAYEKICAYITPG